MRILLLLLLTQTVAANPEVKAPPLPAMSAEVKTQRENDLAAARVVLENDPSDADALIWVGRRMAYLGRYAESIDVFTEGIRRHPKDARMWRHRGHRWITLREFAKAGSDLQQAADLVRGKPDEVEPDGMPNARNIPTSTLQSNIWYHLGLAHYLQGDFEKALRAYGECMKVSKNDDGLVSTSQWLYLTLRRLGRTSEAADVLKAIRGNLDVIENGTYHQLLLMARGELDAAKLAAENASTLDDATLLYGIGAWHLANGEATKARALFQRIVDGPQWASFGYVAAEAELARASQWK